MFKSEQGSHLPLKPSVSVVIPVFNSSSFLETCINSVLRQDYQDYEILIVNDNSKDESLSIIKKFSRLDSRIRYCSLPFNVGAAAARNIAIYYSRGDYIAFLDSDDLWLPSKLSNQFKTKALMEANGKLPLLIYSDYIISNHWNIDFEDINNYKTAKLIPKALRFSDLLKSNYICTSSVLLSKDIAKDIYMPNLKQRHDWSLWLKLLKPYGDRYVAFKSSSIDLVRVMQSKSLSSNVPRSLYFNFIALTKYGDISGLRAFYSFISHSFFAIIRRL